MVRSGAESAAMKSPFKKRAAAHCRCHLDWALLARSPGHTSSGTLPPENGSMRTAFPLVFVISACALSQCSSDRRLYQKEVEQMTASEKVDLDLLAARTRSSDLAAHRKAVVLTAIRESKLGLYGIEAKRRYDAIGSWCGEFARWVYGHSHAYRDRQALEDFEKVQTSSQMENLFARHRSWVPQEALTRATPEPGDYLPVDLDHDRSPNHSTIVVFVSSDQSRVYTIDGNNDHGRDGSRVSLKVRPYWTKDGHAHPMVNGVGKLWQPGTRRIMPGQ